MQAKWLGKCPECGAWNTLERFVEPKMAAGAGGPGFASALGEQAPPVRPISEVSTEDAARMPTGLAELDRVLGGGVVPGSAILLGGEPGIGKSTLLLQALSAAARGGRPVLFATSEESPQQVRLRADRLDATHDHLWICADSNLQRILEAARRVNPAVLAVDSIQMVARPELEASAGSASQLRACCLELVAFAKTTGCAVVMVGHVTKEGTLSGPKMLEHLVDVVLSFEGDRHHLHRVVRAAKNRFGTTHEVGLFEMSGSGLREVDEAALAVDPAAAPRAGAVLVPTLAGSRCLLAELQALTATSFLGSAKRKASGLESGRLAMVIAVLEKHGGVRLADADVFAAAVGGLRIVEPAVDLGLALAVAGAHAARTLPAATAVVGELALSGEIRPVRQLELRAAGARRRGVRTLAVPRAQADALGGAGLHVRGVADLGEALRLLGPAQS